MARGSTQANTSATTAQNNASTLNANAGSIYSQLAPTLESTMANPQGFSPTDEAAMETGAQQSAGGTQAAAVGAGNLMAARTGNSGGAARAVSDASRGAGEQLSQNLLGIRGANAQLKQHQRDSATSGLEGLFGTNVSGGNQALGEVAPLIGADTAAKHQSWDAFNNVTKAITDAAAAASGFGKPGCWIAEAIYGPDDMRTHMVRSWLNGPFRETVIGNAVMTVYIAIGQQVAWVARRSSLLRRALKPLFDKALGEARKWHNS